MPTSQFSSRRKPRQLPFPVPLFSDAPSRLMPPSPNFAPATYSAAAPDPATGFFALPAGTRVAVRLRGTLTASSLLQAAATTTAAAPPVLEQTDAMEDFLATAELLHMADVGEAVPPQATATAAPVASETGDTVAMAGSQNGTLSMASPGGIALGSIAGVAFLVSLLFLLYKWHKGTLPKTLHSATRALKLRRSSPDTATADGAVRDADAMEKGFGSDTSSVRSESTSVRSVSSLRRTFSALKRSASTASSRREPAISAPAAFGDQQADKLAVPLPLHLARLEAAGLWAANGAAGEAAGKMDPRPVVEKPDVHPLRAHRVRTEEMLNSWPLRSGVGSD